MLDSVVVATVRYRHEAAFLHGLLESAGIVATVEGDDFGGEQPALGMVRGVRVLVGPGDADAAKELLASTNPGVDPGASDPPDDDGPR
jgi:hypothetical protein